MSLIGSMSIARGITNSVMHGRGGKALAVGAIGAGALSGLHKGATSQDITGDIFELATGDREIDQYVFGTDIGVRQMLAPMPGDRYRMLNTTTWGRFQTARNQRTNIAERQRTSTDITGRYRDQRAYLDSKLPQVDGSMVLGAYHSRMG